MTLRRWVAQPRGELGRRDRGGRRTRARIWRLYMAGSALAFETGNNQIHQVLAVAPKRVAAVCPCAPTSTETGSRHRADVVARATGLIASSSAADVVEAQPEEVLDLLADGRTAPGGSPAPRCAPRSRTNVELIGRFDAFDHRLDAEHAGEGQHARRHAALVGVDLVDVTATELDCIDLEPSEIVEAPGAGRCRRSRTARPSPEAWRCPRRGCADRARATRSSSRARAAPAEAG